MSEKTHKLTLPSNGHSEKVTKEEGDAIIARFPRAGYQLEPLHHAKQPTDLEPAKTKAEKAKDAPAAA